MKSFEILNKNKIYCLITRFSFKSDRTSLISTFTTCSRPLSMNLILFKIVSISCMSIKRKFIWLISLVFLHLRLLSMFCFKLNSIGSSTIKSSSSPLIMILTLLTMFDMNFMRCIALFVLGLAIKFVFIWLVCVF